MVVVKGSLYFLLEILEDVMLLIGILFLEAFEEEVGRCGVVLSLVGYFSGVLGNVAFFSEVIFFKKD